ncbi:MULTISPECIES: hypothetical protein [Burkholderia]|uniref:hypothetical protein n=1 Tax=Burkholderia TaxID=32008 RepID=UPI0008773AC9|nr:MULTISPECIES: hypothetical protein [Burkholderia]MBH9642464.1 hypothetical protein [Burkholderia vietnamiensis]MBR8009997.1 hypothetical protein [Burkholderia vietnamiensis]MDN8039422.1 hypothetical protein [Burkholderia vietnamiensis]TCT31207.1 hypothetical protein EC918_103105 [Burkholderia vietnamiensis]SCZ21277.1 hypothetical protein SAMN02787148_102240 [Burkholderia vietnamiensis]
MSSLVDKQAPIDFEIANALIVATPEAWRAADMLVEREQEKGQERLRIEISNPDGRKELVQPTDEIVSGLYKLVDLFRAHGPIWTKAAYSVSMADDGQWRYTVNFEY